MTKRKVVITGRAVASPLGYDVEATRSSWLAGQSNFCLCDQAALAFSEFSAAVKALICSCSGLGASQTPIIFNVLYYTRQESM